MADVQLDNAAITAMMLDPVGLVGNFLDDLADQAASVARAAAPVRKSAPWSSRSNTSPAGFTKASIHTRKGISSTGQHLWASANAAVEPTIFLEDPRVDRVKEPFLTTGLWSIEGLL